MNFETLYEEHKWKQHYQQFLEQEQQSQIKTLSSSKKINERSSYILNNKLYEMLAKFRDEETINIETSVPLLFHIKILQVIQSIESAKVKLQTGGFENSRLKWQARFIYCLWKMIDEEEIETRELKQIIYMINQKSNSELKKSLLEIYNDLDAVTGFVEAWKILHHDHQYYKSMEIIERKNNDIKEIEGILNVEMPIKEQEKRKNQDKIKDYFLHQTKCTPNPKNKQKFTIDRGEKSTANIKNKENVIDRAKQAELVNRLYQTDKYKHRQAQKEQLQEIRKKNELQKCTFKPQLTDNRLRSQSVNKRGKSINGYEKAVSRLKEGIEKNRLEKERRDYKPIGENYQKIRQMKINPPKFLERKKEQEKVLFLIQFDLGRHRVKVKVHQNDTEDSIARNLCKIYCLKADLYEQIYEIVKREKAIYEQQQKLNI